MDEQQAVKLSFTLTLTDCKLYSPNQQHWEYLALIN